MLSIFDLDYAAEDNLADVYYGDAVVYGHELSDARVYGYDEQYNDVETFVYVCV